MLIRNSIPFWKSSPFVRLLMPLMVGIVLQWYLQFTLQLIILSFVSFLSAFLLFQFLPLSLRFKVQWLQGISLNLLLLSFGLFITWQKDIRNHADWFGNYYQSKDELVVCIDEPLIEKEKSYKANASVESLINNDSIINCKGKLIIYLSKDSISQKLNYGDEILIHKPLQPINNFGGFDYEQYEAFHQTFHSVFLKNNDWELLKEKDINPLKAFILKAREYILSAIRNNVNDKNEQGIAEALLIGYNNDIDKDLKQAYSNAGVVYLISLSGMSLGLLYVLFAWILSKIPFVRRSEIIKLILMLSFLWLFALLTGGSASVFRSAIMFSCIAVGKAFNKKSSIYNSLAASAFILLCYDPYLLWDIGFQLSYLAITSILVFRKPIYDLIYIKNKWADKIWQLVSVTLSVQILTFPICIYYFHQFPVLFLITNLVAIPLATVILFAELFLIAFYWAPLLDACLGRLIFYLIEAMNKFIAWINSFSFAVVNNLSPSLFYILILYAVIISLSIAFIHKNKTAFRFSLFLTLMLVMMRVVLLIAS
jgi:competence protein ComEC